MARSNANNLDRPVGVRLRNGLSEVRVWAPLKQQVSLTIRDKGEIDLEPEDFGFWSIQTSLLEEGDRYQFVLDRKNSLPDPASCFQPEGVHGYSEVIDLKTYPWQEGAWQNGPLETYIIYELHVGTFSSEGTFDGVIDRLDYLKDLGITAIEIMPVAQFPGDRNWGYDGVFPFAVQASYGGPLGLQRLVDACHRYGIAVILDVVYNHLGPEGNYLEAYGPYFTDKYHTPWGKAVNLDDAYCDGVRHFFVENMRMWFCDYHIDALRLDAVHALKDFGAKHLLTALREALDELSEVTGRTYYLIGECDLNDVRYIQSNKEGGYGLHAQWIDEFHHALRVSVGERRQGYYSDFKPLVHLAKAFTSAYVYDGIYSIHRKKIFGNRAIGAKGKQFVVFSQNHDQIGNRMLGERSSTLYGFDTQLLMATVVLAAPNIPLLFMGEEYGETSPFLYFVSHTDQEIAQAVKKGRQDEFKDFFNDEVIAPDPTAAVTFEQSKLCWAHLNEVNHQTLLKAYRKLIALRKMYAAWYTLDRERLGVELWEEKRVLLLKRWNSAECLFFYFNFDHQQHNLIPHVTMRRAEKIFDTADERFFDNYTEVCESKQIPVRSQSALIFKSSIEDGETCH